MSNHLDSDLTVAALREYLQGYPGAARVRIAHNASWPIAERLVNIAILPDARAEDLDQGDFDEGEGQTVWLATTQVDDYEHPYAPGGAWDNANSHQQ